VQVYQCEASELDCGLGVGRDVRAGNGEHLAGGKDGLQYAPRASSDGSSLAMGGSPRTELGRRGTGGELTRPT
jgi:hypothetical protein